MSWIAQQLPVKLVYTHIDVALASITFDDFPRSAWKAAGPILQSFGIRATYYVAGSLCGQRSSSLEYFRLDDLLGVYAAGHEIGCHTFSHLHVPRVPSQVLVQDLDRNAAFIRDVLGDVWLSSFAYPHGEVSTRTKIALSRRFSSCRGIHSGLNGKAIDLAQLKAVPLYSHSCPADEIERLVTEARTLNGWIIFYTHDVSDRPSAWGCTPALLEHTLDALGRANVKVLPVKHALARVAFPQPVA